MATVTSTLPERGTPPVANSRLWAGVALAPAAWSVAELVGYVLVARACDRAQASAVAHAGVTQAVVAVVLGVIAVAGLVIAVGNWRRVRDTGEIEQPGAPPAWGRAHFMALGGVIASSLFVLGIVFFALPPLFMNSCNQVR